VLVIGRGVPRRQAQAQQQAHANADALATPWPRPKAKKRQISLSVRPHSRQAVPTPRAVALCALFLKAAAILGVYEAHRAPRVVLRPW